MSAKAASIACCPLTTIGIARRHARFIWMEIGFEKKPEIVRGKEKIQCGSSVVEPVSHYLESNAGVFHRSVLNNEPMLHAVGRGWIKGGTTNVSGNECINAG